MPAVDFAAHATLCAFVAGLVAAQVGGTDGDGLVHAVHDVSGGGLAVALAEMAAVGRRPGARSSSRTRPELFTELPSRFVVATADADELCARAGALGIPAAVLGAGRLATASSSAAVVGPAARRAARGRGGQPGPGPGRTVMARACARMGDA